MEEETKCCSKCGVVKGKSEFAKWNDVCKECTYQNDKDRRNSNAESFFKYMVSSARATANRRLNKGRIDAGICTIDWEYIRDLYDKQDGKCHYSNVPMVLQVEADWQCSIERKDQDFGYTPGNLVLCCVEFQSRVQWSTEKYKELMELLFAKNEANISLDMFDKPTDKPRKLQKVEKTVVGGIITHARCTKLCGLLKPRDQFGKTLKYGCKECQSTIYIYVEEQHTTRTYINIIAQHEIT